MKPCPACGSTEVKRWTTMALDHRVERVVVVCDGCGNRRGSWYRKVKTPPQP